MSRLKWRVDKPFLISVVVLMLGGFVIFYSASLGLLAKSSSQYSSVTFSQAVLGLCLGTVAMVIVSRLDYKIWRKWAFWLLLLGIALNILVLFPQIGVEHNGARRWLELGGVSFQPSEVLKFAFVIYFGAWLSSVREKAGTFRYGFLPLLILLGVIGFLLLSQPDTDTFMLITASGMAISLVGGGKWRHLFLLIGIGVSLIFILAITRPYVMQRITTYFHPEQDAYGSSYQVQQSLIAIGSGGLLGRGFGQSVQKFEFLPEPIGDSIFAVQAEEFGFIGAAFLISLFAIFAVRGLKIASHADESFGRLIVVGLVIIITAQAFLNIGAMLGLAPLSGITLPFVSHGGTSLFMTLLEAGVILSVSRGLSKNKK